MNVTSLFPSGTASAANVTPAGGTNWAVLGDGSDATYDDFLAAGGSLLLDLDNYVLPAGSMIKSVQVLFRCRTIDPAGHEKVVINLNDQTDPAWNVTTLNDYESQTAETRNGAAILGPADGTPFTQALVNAMRLGIVTDLPVHGGSASRFRLYNIRADVIRLLQPTVSDIFPSGTVRSTDTTVAWQFNGDNGEPQTYFQVKVFKESDAAVGGFDPDSSSLAVRESVEVASANSTYTLTAPLEDGVYRFYVKAAQIRKHWSPWLYASVTVENGPNAPVLTPASGTVMDTGGGFTASWAYSHPSNFAQGAWALSRKTDGGGALWWDNATSLWMGVETWNTGAVHSKVFAAGAWPNNHTYSWAMAVKDSFGIASSYSGESIIEAVAPPVASISGPSGTLTTTSRPVIAWNYSDGALRGQDAFQAKIFLASDIILPGFDPAIVGSGVYGSGVVAGSATSVASTVDLLTDGTGYYAFVRVLAESQWSDWDSSAFNITITPPNAPTLTAVEDPATNAVLLTITGTGGGAFTTRRHYVERLIPGEFFWTPVRFGTSLVPNGSNISTIRDRECPAQVAVSYRAKVLGTLAGGGLVASPWSTLAPCTLHPAKMWIKDVVGSVFVTAAVDVGAFKPKSKLLAGSFFPVGRDEGVVISEPAFRGMQTPMGIWVKNGTDLSQLKSVLVPGKTLLVQDVLNQQWYVRLSGDLDKEPLVGSHPSLPRAESYRYEVPVTEVMRPGVS